MKFLKKFFVLKLLIQSKVETLVGKMIIASDLKPDDVIAIDYNGSELVASVK